MEDKMKKLTLDPSLMPEDEYKPLKDLLSGKNLDNSKKPTIDPNVGYSEEDRYAPLKDLLSGGGFGEQSEQNMSVGDPASFPEEEVEEVNKEAKSPYLESKSPKEELSYEEKLLKQLRDVRESSKSDIEKAREDDKKRGLYANLASALGSIGASEIQRKAKVDAGIRPYKPVAVDSTVDDVMAERKADIQSLLDEYKIKKAGKPKDFKNIYKVGDQLVRVGEDGKAEKIFGVEGEKEPSFEEKETIKAQVKDKVSQAKENRKIREQAIKSIDNVDDQIKSVEKAINVLDSATKSGLTDTGPIDQFAGKLSGKGQRLEQALNQVSLDKMVKMFSGMSKAIDSDAERAFFQSAQPSMGKYPSENKKILEDMLNRLRSIKNREIKTKESIDLSGKREEVEQSQTEETTVDEGPYGSVVERNGKSYKWNPAVKKYQLLKR